MENGTAYPERSGEPDCVYYMRHGVCGYGNHCRFNHSPDSRIVLSDQGGSKRHFPQRIGQPDCQYYLRTGDCKYGVNCKYHHPWKRNGSPREEVRLNLTGLPMRLGERECMHYARTGACKFGLNCKFHHPQPATGGAVSSMSSSPVYTLGTYPSLDPIPLPLISPTYIMARGSYLPGLRIPAPTSYTPVIFSPHWGFKGPISPVTPLDGIEPSPKANNNTAQGNCSASISTSKPAPIDEDNFPEREGQPECQYFLKTGDCRFGAACKFHHPKGLTPTASPSHCTLSIIGLPLRPGEPQCSFYVRYGICKFGPVCKFDHPILLPYYNALGARPVINMVMGTRSEVPKSMANNSLAESWNGSVLASRPPEEEDRQGSAAVCGNSTADSTHEEVVEGPKG